MSQKVAKSESRCEKLTKEANNVRKPYCFRLSDYNYVFLAAKVEGAGDVGTEAREKGAKGGGGGARSRHEQPQQAHWQTQFKFMNFTHVNLTATHSHIPTIDHIATKIKTKTFLDYHLKSLFIEVLG